MKTKFKIDCFFVFILYFFISMYLMPLYLYGDQIFYRKVYDNFSSQSGFINNYIFYKESLSATEIIHFILTYFFAKIGFDKDFFISIFNAFLFLFAYMSANKLCNNKYLSFFVISSNYYLYVMAFSAERLKFGFLFLFMYVLFENRVYIYMSVFSHFQMILFLLSKFFVSFFSELIKVLYTGKIKKTSLLMFFTFTMIFLIILSKSNLIEKIGIYVINQNFSFFSLLKMAAFLILSLLSMDASNRKNASFQFILIILISSVIGADRTLIIMYFIAMYFCLQYKKGVNAFVFTTSFYYLFSSFYFVRNIIEYNDGFNL